MFDTYQTKTYSPAVKASGRDVGETTGTTPFIGAGVGDRRLEAVVRTAGFDVRRGFSLAEAELNPDHDDIDLIAMETLPGGHVDSTACHQLAVLRMAPILVMAERDDETDRILALKLGADDWASPVCGERELLAKVRALTRRRAWVSRTAPNPNTVRFTNWQLEDGARIEELETVVHALRSDRRPDTETPKRYERELWVPCARGTTRVPGARGATRVSVASLIWVEAARGYVMLHTAARSLILRETMGRLEARLDPRHAIRVHRSAFVNPAAVTEIQRLGKGLIAVLLQNGHDRGRAELHPAGAGGAEGRSGAVLMQPTAGQSRFGLSRPRWTAGRARPRSSHAATCGKSLKATMSPAS